MILRHSQENKILPWLESAVPGAILGLLLLQGCYSIRPPSTGAMDAALSSSPNVIYSRGEFLTLVAEPACGQRQDAWSAERVQGSGKYGAGQG
jgi:hypothetical protein